MQNGKERFNTEETLKKLAEDKAHLAAFARAQFGDFQPYLLNFLYDCLEGRDIRPWLQMLDDEAAEQDAA